ncbi:MAG: AI-2E family transporter [Acetivibrio sp.]
MKQDVKDLWYMIGTTVAVYGAIRYLLPLVVPFLFSYFFAALFYPILYKAKKRWNLSGGMLLILLTGTVITAIGTGIFFLGRAAFFQFQRLVQMLPIYQQGIQNRMQNICAYWDQTFSMKEGTAFLYVTENIKYILSKGKQRITSGISLDTLMEVGKVFGAIWALFIVIWGMVLIIKDMEELKIIYEESWICRHGSKVFKELLEVGMAYGKAQLIIMSIVFSACSVGFLLIGNSYGILLGLFVSIFDAFPVLGSGLVLIPWALVEIFKGQWFSAAMLVTLYVICQVVHEWVEAKIIGSQIGIKPIFTIMAMYAGVKLFGIFGFILGPIALMVIKTVLQNQC